MTVLPLSPPPRRRRLVVYGYIGIPAIVAALLIGGVLLLINAVFSSSDIYAMAMQQARSSPCITDKLGRSIHLSGIISGSVSTAKDNGHADLTIPVHGLHAGGSLVVSGTKANGHWRINSLILRSHGHDYGVNLADPSSCLNWE